MSYFTRLAEELGARRMRLRAAIGDRWASLAEFLWLGGVSLAAMRGLVAPENWAWGFLPGAAAFVGYLLIDLRQQRSRDEAGARPRHDRLALAWVSACAVLGVAFFSLAYVETPSARIELPPAPPADVRYIEIQ